jgi:hypothetical protein
MRWACALALAATAQGTDAIGQIDSPFAKGLPDLAWAERPSEAAFESAKPASVATRGYVILRCGAATDARLTGCTIHLEDPKGQGLKDAALALVPSFRLDVRSTRLVRDAGETVLVQFNWKGDGGPCWPPYCSFIPPPPAPAGSH